jgi:hypothetical protein
MRTATHNDGSTWYYSLTAELALLVGAISLIDQWNYGLQPPVDSSDSDKTGQGENARERSASWFMKQAES